MRKSQLIRLLTVVTIILLIVMIPYLLCIMIYTEQFLDRHLLVSWFSCLIIIAILMNILLCLSFLTKRILYWISTGKKYTISYDEYLENIFEYIKNNSIKNLRAKKIKRIIQ